MRTQQLTIESTVFADARGDLNEVLRRLLKHMEAAKYAEGSVCLRIDVELEKEYYGRLLPDGSTEDEEVAIPRFRHRAYSTVKAKDEIKGESRPDMEIIFNEATGEYELRQIRTAQMSIYDYEDAEDGEI